MKVQIHVENVTVHTREVEVSDLNEALDLDVSDEFTIENKNGEELVYNESRIVGVISLE